MKYQFIESAEVQIHVYNQYSNISKDYQRICTIDKFYTENPSIEWHMAFKMEDTVDLIMQFLNWRASQRS